MEAAVRRQKSTSGEFFHSQSGAVFETGIPCTARDRSGVRLEWLHHHWQIAETDGGHTRSRKEGEEKCGGQKRYPHC